MKIYTTYSDTSRDRQGEGIPNEYRMASALSRSRLVTVTRGFTLLEVLMAMGVFAIGFVFIAAIFPVAALLQKEAVDTINGQQASRNTQAVLQSIPVLATTDLTASHLTAPIMGTGGFEKDQRLYAFNVNGWNSSAWKNAEVRSFPMTVTNAVDRKFYAVPLFRDSNPSTGLSASDVHTYVFILQKRNSAKYPVTSGVLPSLICANSADTSNNIPKVYGAKVFAVDSTTIKFKDNDFNGNSSYDTPTQLDIGDQFIDNNGTIYTVSDYDMTANTITVDGLLLPVPNTIDTIWFASPGEDPDTTGEPSGKNSPTMDILILSGVVN